MTKAIKYTCSCCGKEIEDWPALAYIYPDHYTVLSEEDRQKIGQLDTDFCIIQHPDGPQRFIRCTLSQKVVDHCQNLEYGLWVSLSEKSFQDYIDNYNNEDHEVGYFGWLCNNLPDYDFNESIPTDVCTKAGNRRPEIFPHENFDHPFVRDYYNGITKAEAERRVRTMLKNVQEPNPKQTKNKPWWKLWR